MNTLYRQLILGNQQINTSRRVSDLLTKQSEEGCHLLTLNHKSRTPQETSVSGVAMTPAVVALLRWALHLLDIWPLHPKASLQLKTVHSGGVDAHSH